jgi:hypothetical protein
MTTVDREFIQEISQSSSGLANGSDAAALFTFTEKDHALSDGPKYIDVWLTGGVVDTDALTGYPLELILQVRSADSSDSSDSYSRCWLFPGNGHAHIVAQIPPWVDNNTTSQCKLFVRSPTGTTGTAKAYSIRGALWRGQVEDSWYYEGLNQSVSTTASPSAAQPGPMFAFKCQPETTRVKFSVSSLASTAAMAWDINNYVPSIRGGPSLVQDATTAITSGGTNAVNVDVVSEYLVMYSEWTSQPAANGTGRTFGKETAGN